MGCVDTRQGEEEGWGARGRALGGEDQGRRLLLRRLPTNIVPLGVGEKRRQ